MGLRTYEFTFDDYDEQHILPACIAVTPNALDMLASRSVESPKHPVLAVFKKTLWSNMRLAFFRICLSAYSMLKSGVAVMPSTRSRMICAMLAACDRGWSAGRSARRCQTRRPP